MMKKLRIIRNIVLVLILINVLVIAGYFVYIKKTDSTKKEDTVLVVDKIDKFGYVLDNNQNDYYKTLFDELKDVLNQEEIDYSEYSKCISKLFISDLYTLSNKVSSSDVGGLEFVYSEFKKDFLSIAKTTLYNSVKSNLYGDRQQELPIVSNVNIDSVTNSAFKYGKVEFKDAYVVKASIEYEKDLGYPQNCELILVSNEDVLQVVKLG